MVIAAMTLMLSGTSTNAFASTALLWPLLLCFRLGYLVLSLLMIWLKHGTFAIFGLYRLFWRLFALCGVFLSLSAYSGVPSANTFERIASASGVFPSFSFSNASILLIFKKPVLSPSIFKSASSKTAAMYQ